MPADRPALFASVDEDTRDRYHDFAAAHGVTISALIEALGRSLKLDSGRLPEWQRQAVVDARRIQTERRDRRPED